MEISECISLTNEFSITKMFLQEGDFVPYTNGGMSEERTMKIIRKKKDVLFDMVVSTFFKKAE